MVVSLLNEIIGTHPKGADLLSYHRQPKKKKRRKGTRKSGDAEDPPPPGRLRGRGRQKSSVDGGGGDTKSRAAKIVAKFKSSHPDAFRRLKEQAARNWDVVCIVCNARVGKKCGGIVQDGTRLRFTWPKCTKADRFEKERNVQIWREMLLLVRGKSKCRNWAMHGKCRFGNKCRYEHEPRL